jgi:UDP-N-acetylmuramate--alanine ligase
MKQPNRIIISGGGTGGHIFPAISIANTLKERFPNVEIRFVGASNRMEMERVPAAGYRITGLPVSGFDRTHWFKNIIVIFRLIKSLCMAMKIVREFKPDIAIGVGGYAAGPTLWAVARLKIPILIQEQNSYPGITNKLLAKKANTICVAYEGMEKFFPPDRTIITGNPVRKGLVNSPGIKSEALRFFHFSAGKKTIFVTGGSLGAHTINRSIWEHLDRLAASGIQLIWQTGPYYYAEAKKRLEKYKKVSSILCFDFITRMDYAYAAADLVISRAGAGTISELCLLAKPVILVPSPNVAEDHQTRNALALAEKNAAILVTDAQAVQCLAPKMLEVVNDNQALHMLAGNIASLAQSRSAERIVDEIVRIISLPASNYGRSCHPVDRKNIKAVYFAGAGGIGMSALVRFFLSKGMLVAGYDKTPSELTEELNHEGAFIHYTDDASQIPGAFRSPDETLVIYTPALPESHAELTWFRTGGFEVLKRSQALGEITKAFRGLCVAGTHGKTTTSSMTAHLLRQSTVDCNAFLGGILKNYNTNLLLSDKSDLVVIEADEYDRSFHWLTPYMAVITSADPDHLDIYGTPEAYRDSFEHFTSLIRSGGCLIMKKGIPLSPRMQSATRLYTYSVSDEADFMAENIRIGNGKACFDFAALTGLRIRDVELGVPIRVNIENAVAAIALAWLNGVSEDEIRRGMLSFAGAKRRFDFHLKRDDIVLIDDYAHHPAELRESILSVKELYAGKKICGIFQPHLYSRTRDFANDFAEALSLLDQLILLDIYPAREAPIPGVSSRDIFDKIRILDKTLCTREQLLEIMATGTYEVVIMLGAGDIDRLVEPVKQLLDK